jgi:hypothetical protein
VADFMVSLKDFRLFVLVFRHLSAEIETNAENSVQTTNIEMWDILFGYMTSMSIHRDIET